jgi:acetolactate synthase-1/2/3 large subunit
LKSSDFIVRYLFSQGLDTVFEVIGGMTTHLIDSLARFEKIKIVPMKHEQSASFAVDAYGRIKGIPCFAMATSGPGAINLLTGIGSCYFDSVPAIFLTGQVNTFEQKRKSKIRQSGFQETDIVSMAKPICKAVWKISKPEDIPSVLEKALKTACSDRPGPVLIDIPMDMQRCCVNAKIPDKFEQCEASVTRQLKSDKIHELFNGLIKAKRPLILAGGGLRASKSVEKFRALVEQLKIPVVNSLMGVDSLEFLSPFHCGLIGSYGNRWANLALGKSDFLIVLGSRLDIRQTGSDKSFLTKDRIVWHVDCDENEIGAQVKGCKTLLSHLDPFMEKMIEIAKSEYSDGLRCKDWLEEIEDLKRAYPDTDELKDITGINPNIFFHKLSNFSKAASTYIADVGQHQMWAAQSLELTSAQRFITSGGMGAMGFALPASIGACFAIPGKPVVAIAGDGGMQMNIQELETVFRNKLPVKIVVINNSCLGMVRQFQESYFSRRYQSTIQGYSSPDFVKVAQSYGIESCCISLPEEMEFGLKKLWDKPLEAYLLEVKIDSFANVYPKIAFGYPLTNMEPFVKPIEMECT